MADVSDLVQRIRNEFSESQEKLKKFQQDQVEAHHAKLDRLERLEEIFDQLQAVWRPRLEALAQEFGDRLEATPKISKGQRQAALKVESSLARIRLSFAAMANPDVTELILIYDLEILPVLMQFERHAEIAFPLDDIDAEAIGKWFDDRIVGFVRTYLALHENEYYLKDHMVEDPIAHVRFPKFAAGATRNRQGKTYYFISEETATDFEKQAS